MDLESFIKTVQSFPQLWDKKNDQYGDPLAKETTWQTISDIINISVEDCKLSWKNARDRYVKEKRLFTKGSSGYVRWPYYQMCSFLDSNIKPRRTIKNIRQFKNERQKSENVDGTVIDNVKMENDIQQNINGVVEEVVQEDFNSQTSFEDYHFGQSVAAALANIKNNKKKLQVKAKILLLISEETE